MGTMVLKYDLINKHGSCGTMSLGTKKTQCRKTKCNPKVLQ